MDKDILLNQFVDQFLKFSIPSQEGTNYLSLTLDKDLKWVPLNPDRLGIGRKPLHNYVVDIAVPKNTLMTALHIGDGSYGFSFGNGTTQGFVPEIIGIGSDTDDPGLYFLGIATDDNLSDIPLIVFDGRSENRQTSANRPIIGIKSGERDYDLMIDKYGNVIIKKDIIIGQASLLKTIEELETKIKILETKINELQ